MKRYRVNFFALLKNPSTSFGTIRICDRYPAAVWLSSINHREIVLVSPISTACPRKAPSTVHFKLVVVLSLITARIQQLPFHAQHPLSSRPPRCFHFSFFLVSVYHRCHGNIKRTFCGSYPSFRRQHGAVTEREYHYPILLGDAPTPSQHFACTLFGHPYLV